MRDFRMSIVYRNGLAAALPFDMPFAPPTLSKIFLPVASQSRLLPGDLPCAPPSLSERLLVAARLRLLGLALDRAFPYTIL